jgi:glycosyltransferase involved in cell wall biosynthesis
MIEKRIAFVQEYYPHYREFFVGSIKEHFGEKINFFSYGQLESIPNGERSNIKSNRLRSWKYKSLTFFNMLPLLRKYDVIIVPGEIKNLSVWMLLLLSKILPYKVILFGHGISVTNYLKEEQKFYRIRVIFNSLSNAMWLYTNKERDLWRARLSNKEIYSLNNTLNLECIDVENNRYELKNKYKIKTKYNLIFCARFNNLRRVDLLIDVINRLPNYFGIIIIGDGENKPNFDDFENVYDFGSVYDENIKNELFYISDLYFQPAWCGLSIVDAMFHGKPILTFKRNYDLYQCVEYSYVINGENGFIFENTEEIITYLNLMSDAKLNKISKTTKVFSEHNLQPSKMINTALHSIESL